MTTAAIRQKLHQYIDTADEQHIETVYSFIQEGLTGDQLSDKWNDAAFITEMEQRVLDLQTGTDAGHTWEELKQAAKNSVKDNTEK